MKKKLSTRQTEELMRRYVATMRDEKESDLSRLRESQSVAPVKEEKPKKRLSYGARYALIAACSCVLLVAILLPVVFSGTLFAAKAPSGSSYDSKDMPNYDESFPTDADHNKSSYSPSPSQRGYVATTDTFRVDAPKGNTVTYELLPEEERPTSAEDEKNGGVGLQADLLYSIVEWIVFTDNNGMTARVYIARSEEKKARYEKTYDRAVLLGAYRLQYKITSGQEGVFSANGKIEQGDETVYIEYTKTGGDLEGLCSWVNSAVVVKTK